MTRDDYEHVGQNPVPDKGSETHFPEGLRVLAVDDNMVCLKLLARLLQKCCYEVTMTTNASQALEMLRNDRDKYDIVITDVEMPHMDGFELLEIIGLEMDIPVIMMSANDDRDWVMKGVEHGARDYLLKPVRIEGLKHIWKHIIMSNRVDPKKLSIIKREQMDQNPIPLKRLRDKGKEKSDERKPQSNGESCPQKKPRVVWTPRLHKKFVAAVQQLGVDSKEAVPKKILQLMNEPDLSREHVASHLQKFRDFLKKDKRKASHSIEWDSQGQHAIDRHSRLGGQTIGNNVGMITMADSLQTLSTPTMNMTPLFLPLNPQETVLSQNLVLPQVCDQMFQAPISLGNPHSQLEFNDIKLPALYPRRQSLNNYMGISPHVPSFTPYPRGLGVFNLVGHPSPQYGEISQPDFHVSLVPSTSTGGFQFRRQATGNDQMSFLQPPPESLDRENNFQQYSCNSTEDELSIMLKQFGNNSAPNL